MPDPRVPRPRSHRARKGRPPGVAVPGEPGAAGTPGTEPPSDGTEHLEPDAAASAEAEAAALAADDVAGEAAASTEADSGSEPEAVPTEPDAVPAEADAGSEPVDTTTDEAIGWFREEPIDATGTDDGGPGADVPDDATRPIDAVETGQAEPEPATIVAAAALPADATEPVARERESPVVAPPPTSPARSRGSRIRGLLVGIVTIVVVAAVGFVAGLMLPTILPGPGVGSSETSSPAASVAPTASTAPTSSVVPTPETTTTPAPTPVATTTPGPTSGPTPAPTQVVYVVKAGDQLARIAAKYGVTVAAIQAANNIKDPNLIKIGQKLIIPLPAATQAP